MSENISDYDEMQEFEFDDECRVIAEEVLGEYDFDLLEADGSWLDESTIS